ncbi:MAG TPA: hypothetical protein VKD72_00235, partial [Gemmataceae bacterium]|nr:hypothetical protein [Gemmataceae bacterium]
PPQEYNPPTTSNPPPSTPSTSPSVTLAPAPSPSVDPEVARREQERRLLRGLLETGENSVPVESLRVLKEKETIFDRACFPGRPRH